MSQQASIAFEKPEIHMSTQAQAQAKVLADFVREHSEIRRQVHRALWDEGYRPGDGQYEQQAERRGMPGELNLPAILMLLGATP